MRFKVLLRRRGWWFCDCVFGTPKSPTQNFRRMIQTVYENRMNNRTTIVAHLIRGARIPHMTVENFNTTSLKIVQNLTCSSLHHTVYSTCLLCYFLFGLLLISVECFFRNTFLRLYSCILFFLYEWTTFFFFFLWVNVEQVLYSSVTKIIKLFCRTVCLRKITSSR